MGDVLKLVHDLEKAINDDKTSPLRGLDIAFKPVGSVTEGTRVGRTNEMDFMVFFRFNAASKSTLEHYLGSKLFLGNCIPSSASMETLRTL